MQPPNRATGRTFFLTLEGISRVGRHVCAREEDIRSYAEKGDEGEGEEKTQWD
jgi:hypothetical protein